MILTFASFVVILEGQDYHALYYLNKLVGTIIFLCCRYIMYEINKNSTKKASSLCNKKSCTNLFIAYAPKTSEARIVEGEAVPLVVSLPVYPPIV